ncbi:uncharacterized protein [Antedon mediterranea]|uniref:uncharacterized protein n=1 Tax=Antedon mediterranea TaxID=105859 RepID=UPI003AF44F9C
MNEEEFGQVMTIVSAYLFDTSNDIVRNRLSRTCGRRPTPFGDIGKVVFLQHMKKKEKLVVDGYLRLCTIPIPKRVVIPRSDEWWVNVLENFTDEDWLKHFRMRRQTFEHLCETLTRLIQRQNNPFGRNLPVDKCVAIALSRLATGENLRALSKLFGVARSTACKNVNSVCNGIVNMLREEYIIWPEGDRLVETIRGFREKYGIVQCAGAVDASHVPIAMPYDHPDDYENQNGWHSIVLQAVADDKLRFTNVDVGWPGNIKKNEVLKNSKLYQKGTNEELFPKVTEELSGTDIPPVTLIADSGYPLTNWMITPFPDANTDKQQEFNDKLSKANMVKRSLKMLRGRWHVLAKRNENALRNVGQMVIACCVLHNFCIVKGEPYRDEWDMEESFEQPTCENITQLEKKGDEEIRAQYFL